MLLTGPNPAWRNEADCGEAVFMGAGNKTVLLNCAGPAHVHFRDMDGSLFRGSSMPAAMSGVFGASGRSFPYDQATPVLPGPCTYSDAYSSYSCVANSSAFLLDSRLKPDPLPAKGIFGAPHHFVLESRDADTETRNFGPVAFNVSGSVDLVSAAMDNVSRCSGAGATHSCGLQCHATHRGLLGSAGTLVAAPRQRFLH